MCNCNGLSSEGPNQGSPYSDVEPLTPNQAGFSLLGLEGKDWLMIAISSVAGYIIGKEMKKGK